MLVNFEKHAIKVYQYSFIDFDLHKKKAMWRISMLYRAQQLAYNFVHCGAKF